MEVEEGVGGEGVRLLAATSSIADGCCWVVWGDGGSPLGYV